MAFWILSLPVLLLLCQHGTTIVEAWVREITVDAGIVVTEIDPAQPSNLESTSTPVPARANLAVGSKKWNMYKAAHPTNVFKGMSVGGIVTGVWGGWYYGYEYSFNVTVRGGGCRPVNLTADQSIPVDFLKHERLYITVKAPNKDAVYPHQGECR